MIIKVEHVEDTRMIQAICPHCKEMTPGWWKPFQTSGKVFCSFCKGTFTAGIIKDKEN